MDIRVEPVSALSTQNSFFIASANAARTQKTESSSFDEYLNSTREVNFEKKTWNNDSSLQYYDNMVSMIAGNWQ